MNFGNYYCNSEGYYMSLRTSDLDIKMKISAASIKGGQASRNARKLYDLDMDENNRMQYMMKAVKVKFDLNPDLRIKLLNIRQEIIEKNYWKDDLFGVRTDTLEGANLLGKILMFYRDKMNANNYLSEKYNLSDFQKKFLERIINGMEPEKLNSFEYSFTDDNELVLYRNTLLGLYNILINPEECVAFSYIGYGNRILKFYYEQDDIQELIKNFFSR